MRRGRRGGHGVLEFGGSGEDSFVAVVVTKLTGALLFILLLAMVIMALLPKAAGPTAPLPPSGGAGGVLTIVTPERLPEAIVGRPYELAMAATGGVGPLRWSIAGPVPEGLTFDPARGLLEGTPTRGLSEPALLTVRVSDGDAGDARQVRLLVYKPDGPLSLPNAARVALLLPRVPWEAWIEAGFGFLVLLLVHQVAVNGVATLERRAWAIAGRDGSIGGLESARIGRRFGRYRLTLRIAGAIAAAVLAAWLWTHRTGDIDAESARPSAVQGEPIADTPADEAGRKVLR